MPFPFTSTRQIPSATSGTSNSVPRRSRLQRGRTRLERRFSSNSRTNSAPPVNVEEQMSDQDDAEAGTSSGPLARPDPFNMLRRWSVEARLWPRSFVRRVLGIDRCVEEQAQREEARNVLQASIYHANHQIDPRTHSFVSTEEPQEAFEYRYPMRALQDVPPSMRRSNGRPNRVLSNVEGVSVLVIDLSGDTLVGDTLVSKSVRSIEQVP